MLPKIVRGQIGLWRGTIGTIPAGWFLCDGTHGTPDLRNRFVVMSGNIYDIKDTGGNTLHAHGFTGDGHGHFLIELPEIDRGPIRSRTTQPKPAAGTTDVASSLPPYYAVAYIMFRGV